MLPTAPFKSGTIPSIAGVPNRVELGRNAGNTAAGENHRRPSVDRRVI
jgi:hypothetical protein